MAAQKQSLPSFASILSVLSFVFHGAGFLRESVAAETKPSSHVPDLVKFPKNARVLPRVSLHPGPHYAIEGSNYTLPTCHVTGYPAPLVTWRKLSGQLPQGRIKYNDSRLQILQICKNDSDVYFCSAANLLGRVKKKTFLFVVSPPRFTVKPPANVLAAVGETLRLSCNATGDPQPVISWKKQGGQLPVGRSQQINGALVITDTTLNDKGTYVCVATSAGVFKAETVTYTDVWLITVRVGPQLSLSSKRLIAEEKQNVTFVCTATGQPQPSITWSKYVGSLPKDRTAVKNGALTIYEVTRNDGGTYICKAENILGSATGTAQLLIFSPLRFKVRPPQEVTPMIGSTVRLPCVAESDLRPTTAWTKDGESSLPAVDSNVLLNGTLVLQNIKKSHEGSYTCRATNDARTIEAEVKVNSPVKSASCSVIRKYVSSVSGNYIIDPDGEGGLAPFTVFCDMTDKSGVGVTVIGHNSEIRTHVAGYDKPGTYSRDIHYTGASLSQLASLTRVSSHCEQFIKYECYRSRMFRPGYAWWVSRDSRKMTYWGGASRSGKCKCGMTHSCVDFRFGCNCDTNDFVWHEDSGLLTDKTKLPVTQLRFGDIDNYRKQGYHTLGKFKCYGTA